MNITLGSIKSVVMNATLVAVPVYVIYMVLSEYEAPGYVPPHVMYTPIAYTSYSFIYGILIYVLIMVAALGIVRYYIHIYDRG